MSTETVNAENENRAKTFKEKLKRNAPTIAITVVAVAGLVGTIYYRDKFQAAVAALGEATKELLEHGIVKGGTPTVTFHYDNGIKQEMAVRAIEIDEGLRVEVPAASE